jgi:hypothetical protein
MLYRCELITDDVITERIFREGESAQAIREDLGMFQWPAGKWRIEPAEQPED